MCKIRYIKDTVSGSDKNGACQWVEIQAFDYKDVNVALNKKVSISSYNKMYGELQIVTNGNLSDEKYISSLTSDNSPQYVIVDLGKIYNIKSILIKRYSNDNRIYRKPKTEISENYIDWKTINDEIEYLEPKNGKIFDVSNINNLTYLINKDNKYYNPKIEYYNHEEEEFASIEKDYKKGFENLNDICEVNEIKIQGNNDIVNDLNIIKFDIGNHVLKLSKINKGENIK